MMISVAHLVNLYGVDGYLSPFAAILTHSYSKIVESLHTLSGWIGHEFGMACEAKCEK